MKDVYNAARDAGLYTAIWRPGDGMARYRFFTTGVVARNDQWVADYHQGQELTTLPRAMALVWLAGYRAGRNGQ